MSEKEGEILMKIRQGFVSNSSSSSFVISINGLSESQLKFLKNVKQKAKLTIPAKIRRTQRKNCMNEFGYYNEPDIDMWNIEYEKDNVSFSVIMTNFDMEQFILNYGIPKEAIRQ